MLDAAPPGSRLEIPAGEYAGDVIIDKPLTLVGVGRPRLVGSGTGSVVRVRADDVTIEGFEIDGLGGGDLGRDSSGVHVAAKRATVRDCVIVNTLFGVYLYEADGSAIETCRIRGVPGKDPGEKGSGIHAYNTLTFRFVGNEVVDVRDGLYLQNSSQGQIRRNRVRDVRYGLHYMFSDDNTFEDNIFENGAAGSAIMYSERIVFRRNRFLHNRGFASVGLLLQQCDDVIAEHNLIADNARGIFLEGTNRVSLTGNVVAKSDIAIVAFDSATATRFEGNSFVGYMSPLMLVGRKLDARVRGQLLVGPPGARPRRRRAHRPALPAGQRLRSPARKPHRRRPLRGRVRRVGARRWRRRRFRCSRRRHSRKRRRSSARRTLAEVPTADDSGRRVDRRAGGVHGRAASRASLVLRGGHRERRYSGRSSR